MEEKREETSQEEGKSAWQAKKEGWYDKVPLTVKQLDIIITVCCVLLGIVILCIALESMGLISLFS